MDPNENPGGIVNWSTNQKVTSADLRRIGRMAEQSLWDGLVAELFRDPNTGTVASGFVGGGSCAPTSGGGLVIDVDAGWGLVHDSAEADAFVPVYKPIKVPAADSVTLGAHDATNPRIDVVSVTFADVEDTNASRQIWDSGGGVFTPTLVDTRVIRSYSLMVTAGTPAGVPAAPATPAGHLKICEVEVPAAAGAVVITDSREFLQIEPEWTGTEGAVYTEVTVGAENGADTIQVTIEAQDARGNLLATAGQWWALRLLDENFNVIASGGIVDLITTVAVEDRLGGDNKPAMAVQANLTGAFAGQAIVDVLGDAGGQTYYLEIRPIRVGGVGADGPAVIVALSYV